MNRSCGSASPHRSSGDLKWIAFETFREMPKVIWMMPKMTDIFICRRECVSECVLVRVCGGGDSGGVGVRHGHNTPPTSPPLAPPTRTRHAP